MTPQGIPTAGLGLIEVHAHLIPAVDDGSRTAEESLRIARRIVERGYRELVCTPHIWPSLPRNTPGEILRQTRVLQDRLDAAAVGLKLHPGGEINLQPGLLDVNPDDLPTFGNLGRHFLVDMWLWEWEPWLTPLIRHLQQGGRGGRTVVLAHPERLGLLQEDAVLVEKFEEMGVLLQGNLYCFADPPGEPTRELADRYLDEGRYFMLGGDLHREDTLERRFDGLERLTDRVGLDGVARLLRDRPAELLRGDG